MAKTYTAPTTVSAGDAITASLYNTYVGTNVANLIVPPAAAVQRTSNLSSYPSATDITWQSAAYDTDSMWSAGAPTRLTINTTGLYILSVSGLVTASPTINGCSIGIQRNGVNCFYQYTPFTSNALRFFYSVVCNLTATDYLTVNAEISGGSGYAIGGGAALSLDNTRLSATWIGRTS